MSRTYKKTRIESQYVKKYLLGCHFALCRKAKIDLDKQLFVEAENCFKNSLKML